MKRAILTIAAAATIAVGTMSAPSTANARCYGCAVGAGIVAGAIIGGAIAKAGRDIITRRLRWPITRRRAMRLLIVCSGSSHMTRAAARISATTATGILARKQIADGRLSHPHTRDENPGTLPGVFVASVLRAHSMLATAHRHRSGLSMRQAASNIVASSAARKSPPAPCAAAATPAFSARRRA